MNKKIGDKYFEKQLGYIKKTISKDVKQKTEAGELSDNSFGLYLPLIDEKYSRIKNELLSASGSVLGSYESLWKQQHANLLKLLDEIDTKRGSLDDKYKSAVRNAREHGFSEEALGLNTRRRDLEELHVRIKNVNNPIEKDDLYGES